MSHASRGTPAVPDRAPANAGPARSEPSESSSPRAFWLGVAAFSLLALAARFSYVEWIGPPLREVSDANGYYHTGRNLAEGIGYVRWSKLEFDGVRVPSAEYPPLFSFLLAFLQLLGVSSVEGQRLVVGMLGAVNVLLVSVLGRALVDARTGLVAGALATLSPALLEIDGSFMTEALYVPLVTTSYFVVLRATRTQTLLSWLGAGAMLGLCALTRSEALLFLPLLVLPIVWLGGQRQRTLAVAAAALGLCAVVLPWTIRNAVVVGAFVPISQSSKGVLIGANCPRAYFTDMYRGAWSFRCLRRFEPNVQGVSEAEAFDRRRDAGIRYMMAHTEALPSVIKARVLRTWGLYQPGRWYGLGDLEARNKSFSRRTWWVGWLLLALAPPGLWLIWRRSAVGFVLMLAPMAVVTLTTVIAYGNVRFRAAAEPCLLVLAATSLSACWTLLRGGTIPTRGSLETPSAPTPAP